MPLASSEARAALDPRTGPAVAQARSDLLEALKAPGSWRQEDIPLHDLGRASSSRVRYEELQREMVQGLARVKELVTDVRRDSDLEPLGTQWTEPSSSTLRSELKDAQEAVAGGAEPTEFPVLYAELSRLTSLGLSTLTETQERASSPSLVMLF